jgi:hypothetical protein
MCKGTLARRPADGTCQCLKRTAANQHVTTTQAYAQTQAEINDFLDSQIMLL